MRCSATTVAGIRHHTSQELEGCRVQLVNRSINVDGRAALLAVQPGALLIVAHGGSVGSLSSFSTGDRRAAGYVAAEELQSVSVSMSASASAWMPSYHPHLHVCTASRRVGGGAR
jgi:hypothetical protein